MATKPSATEPLGLHGKLAKIAGELSWVEKTGWNDAQKYKYVPVENVVDAVRRKLAANGVTCIPNAIGLEVRPTVSGKQHVTTVKLEYLLTDSETGEYCVVPWYGTGADSGDKGLFKAYTGALKYFFIDLFQIPTGMDPDQEAERQRARGGQAAREAKLSVAQRKKVIAAVEATVSVDEWTMFRTSLGVESDEALTIDHAKQVRAWLDKRAKA